MMKINEILKKMPHRYPFIFVDKVLHIEPFKRIIAIKNVSINEPYFVGHFPSQPIMPGVLILEALAQASIILANESVGTNDIDVNEDFLYVFAGIDNARFKKLVIPGDQLHLQVDFLKSKQSIWKMHGVATVNGAEVCSAELFSARRRYE